MMLYHGSPHKFNEFKPPSVTGNFRPSEGNRTHHTDVIFLTSTRHLALQYAGKNGYLYVVNVANPVVYGQEGKKRPIVRDDVFVAKPENINIFLRLKLAPRRRHQEQEFFLDNY